jgi:hypothetical protein
MMKQQRSQSNLVYWPSVDHELHRIHLQNANLNAEIKVKMNHLACHFTLKLHDMIKCYFIFIVISTNTG